MKSERSKMCDISPKVRQAVVERDNGLCVVCGRVGFPNAHYISRRRGGLGIEENIVTLCPECHRDFDYGSIFKQTSIGEVIKAYLQSKYENWKEEDLYFRHWSERNKR